MKKMRAQETRDTLGQAILQDIKQKKSAWDRDPAARQQDRKINTAIRQLDFHQAFVPLKILQDEEQHIETTYKKISTHWTLIRDARYQKRIEEEQHEGSYYSYTQLAFNLLSGLKDLLDIKRVTNYNEALKKAAKTFYDDIKPQNNTGPAKEKAEAEAEQKFGHFYHEFLVPFYQKHHPEKISAKKAIEQLSLARHFANMKHDAYATATISQHNTHDFVEVEMPIVELTEEQQQQYNQLENQTWYTHQDALSKALIIKYKDRILSGAMIPAQLLRHLIGSRNAFEKWTAVLGNQRTRKPHIINKTFHAGTQAHLFKNHEAAEKATQESVAQIKQATQAAHLFVTLLVTPNNPMSPDAAIASQISKTACRSDNHSTNIVLLPINALRRIQKPNITALNELVQSATAFMNEQNTALIKPHIEALKHSLNSRSTTWLTRFMGIGNDSNIKIASCTDLLIDAINRAPGNTEKMVSISGCVSGQDRTGTKNLELTWKAICAYFKRENIARNESDILQTLADAGHTQENCSNPGTGFGGLGIKPQSKSGFPSTHPKKVIETVTKRTGELNEKTPRNPHARGKYFWLKVLIGLTVIGLSVIAYISYRSKKIKYPRFFTRHKQQNTQGHSIDRGVESRL